MIPRECKRLIEVDFPIARVSYFAAKEKSIRHRHPSTLHLWWARRPLASCRAVLLGLLLPDPQDPHCPPEFKAKARTLLAEVAGSTRGYALKNTDAALRQALLQFIGEFANWDVSSDPLYLKVSRGLVKVAHPEETPLVVDPFAGGGSIPLEALRLGCEAFASDLNPVACLILKVLLEDIPRHGVALAQELREVGARIKAEAEKELAEFYPQDPDGSQPIAYLWARTVRCEAPHCGAEIPLARSFWLCKKAGKKLTLRPRVDRPAGQPPQVALEMFAPQQDREVPTGTVSRAKARCLACGMVLPPERVRAQLAEQRGGADVVFQVNNQPVANAPGSDIGNSCRNLEEAVSPNHDRQGVGKTPPQPRRLGGARLLAVVTVKPGQKGRFYRLATARDYQAVGLAQQALNRLAAQTLPGGLSPIPDEPTPAGGGSGAGRAFSVQRYGMLQWGDLFTARQKVALTLMAEKARALTKNSKVNMTIMELEGLIINRVADYYSSSCAWHVPKQLIANTFRRNALPIEALAKVPCWMIYLNK